MLTYPLWRCNKHRNRSYNYAYNVKSPHSFQAACGFEYICRIYFKNELRVTASCDSFV